MRKEKLDIITFKVPESLREAMKGIPNRSEVHPRPQWSLPSTAYVPCERDRSDDAQPAASLGLVR